MKKDQLMRAYINTIINKRIFESSGSSTNILCSRLSAEFYCKSVDGRFLCCRGFAFGGER